MPLADSAVSSPNDAEIGEPGRVIQVEERDERPCVFRYITAVIRTWGLLTAIAIWACTVVLLKNYTHYGFTPWYLLFMSIVYTFFECVWILNKSTCCRDDGGCCCVCWKAILWIDDWRKFIAYILLAIPCFLKGIVITMAIVSGLLVLASGVFYLLKTIKKSDCIEKKRRTPQIVDISTSPKATLVEHEVQSATSDLAYGATSGVSPVQPPAETVRSPVMDPPAPQPSTTATTEADRPQPSTATPTQP